MADHIAWELEENYDCSVMIRNSEETRAKTKDKKLKVEEMEKPRELANEQIVGATDAISDVSYLIK